MKWLLAILLAGCGVLVAPGGPPTRAPVFAVMHRFACLGDCPDYELTVYADGTVVYQGNADVYVHGKRTATIGAAGVERLRHRFADADFMHLAHDYTPSEDDAMGIVWLVYQGKRIDFQLGFQNTPPALAEIANEIDTLADSARWTERSVCDEPTCAD